MIGSPPPLSWVPRLRRTLPAASAAAGLGSRLSGSPHRRSRLLCLAALALILAPHPWCGERFITEILSELE